MFATEADATEFVQTVQDVQTRITDSRILSGLLKKQHALMRRAIEETVAQTATPA